ncbi:MAG: hypothetical protein MUF45_18165 [Spirosomaceae bacterium]|jgi:hypothetical protein|nr:hypothetical protein [Spirosomataceae bacterium]
MNKPTYQLEETTDGFWYEFNSENNGKIIRKAVAYYPTDSPEIYQLVFGDLNKDGSIDFFSVSNNNDMVKILSTVIDTLYQFFERNSTKIVIFRGSTDTRNRLYRAVITKLLVGVSHDFEVRGINADEEVESFRPNTDYFAYVINKK